MLAKTEPSTARDIVADLVKHSPAVARNELFEAFQGKISSQPSLRRSVEWYFFIQMYTEIVAPSKRPTVPNSVGEREINTMKDAIKSKIVLLDLLMPNGKPLRNCTGAEAATFGNRFKVVADRVGKTKLVGAVLNEADLQKIMS